MLCDACKDTGIQTLLGEGGTTVGAGTAHCFCATGDEQRAMALLMELIHAEGMALDGEREKVGEIVLRHMGRARQAAYTTAHQLMQEEQARWGEGKTFRCPCGRNYVHPGTLLAAGLGLGMRAVEGATDETRD